MFRIVNGEQNLYIYVNNISIKAFNNVLKRNHNKSSWSL